MQYEEAINYIHSFDKFGMKPGLERISALCRALGNPQKGLRFIHVAGTNGKGSTSTMLANICTCAGYRTGLFISPYVIDFCERIQIDGRMIERDHLASVMDDVKKAADALIDAGETPTEFEIITAAAFLYYRHMQCDIVVLETGLGGRLDATNVIDCPLVNVITSVSLDHTAVLGDTIEAIAAEKCGILKSGGICVTYPLQNPQALRVICETCSQRNVRLIKPNAEAVKILDASIFGTDAVIDGISVRVPLLGRHMVYNASMAVAAAKALQTIGLAVTDECISRGIARTVLPARMQIVRERPLVLMDGGHNEDCAMALHSAITAFLPGRHIVGICGLMADKAYTRYLAHTAPLFDKLITVRPDNPRALSAQALCEAARPFCSECTAADSFAQAAELALHAAGPDGVIVVCGSFYMINDLEKYLK